MQDYIRVANDGVGSRNLTLVTQRTVADRERARAGLARERVKPGEDAPQLARIDNRQLRLPGDPGHVVEHEQEGTVARGADAGEGVV